MLVIYDTLSYLSQSTAEGQSYVTNLMMVNTTLNDQVGIHTNILANKETDNEALQMSVIKLHGKV